MCSPGNSHNQECHQVNGNFRRKQKLNALPQLLHNRTKWLGCSAQIETVNVFSLERRL